MGICKRFDGISVLKNVDLRIHYGEVHALMGENGAGKSTLIKIITGVYTKDEGDIYVDGNPVKISTRYDATALGISVIYQELSLIPALTVAENIYLGHETTKLGKLSKRKMSETVQALIDRYEFDLNANTTVESLGMAKRQMVEILKALSADAKLIIMDEPTSSLSTAESERLFETIAGLRKKGASILYISHRLDEVYRIADRLTVMRDGEIVGVLGKDDINAPVVTKMMIGREIKQDAKRETPAVNEANCLEIKGLSYKNILKDINFKAYGGEVLGIGGLVGSGRTELIKCIYGALDKGSGDISLKGKPVSKIVRKNIKNGFGFVPEDRLREGYAPGLSVARNIVVSSYDILAKTGVVSHSKERKHADKAIRDYDIRPPLRNLPIRNLSGGNQQKVVLSRWLSRKLQVLLLDEPTVGVDVGVKEDLYNYIWEQAESGAIVILVSSDLAELTYVSDRILVMYGGCFFEEFTREDVSQSAILQAASGVHTEEGRAI